ncbi:MAG: hypothetical protein OXI57_02825 [Rhodospirillales bacterium]|nr:hypothetical protein [Rhodospirillales bacterium]
MSARSAVAMLRSGSAEPLSPDCAPAGRDRPNAETLARLPVEGAG